MRMFIFVASTAAFIGCISPRSVFAQEPVTSGGTDTSLAEVAESAEKPLDFWMQKKLDYSSSILRGLAMNDFDLIQENARQMRLLNKIEGFVRGRDAQYRRQVRVFEHVTDELIEQADKKSTDGVTLAFNHLTVSCVRCHETLRQERSPLVPVEKLER